ncbi:hypothetical protein Taro_035707 [Colocasia esculenta]|uniref:PPC domain-containing protein n=1 Tax=Colocasia esculenta TaxID=4460 RepID=A0A843WJF8_COLES|nr:hypothetical protein [Colocasia esculenta]
MLAGVAVMQDSGAASMALFPPPRGADQGGDENGAKAANFDRAPNVGVGALVPATSGARSKPRGRPRGSKNKPKATVVVTRESEAAMRAVVLELSAGFDVLASVLGFARRRGVGVSVLSGCGGVSDVTLRHPACSSTLTFRGLFDILSLTGAFLPAAPRWSAPSSPASPASSHFTISLAGSQGELIGGVVEGPLIAAGTVRLMVATFASLEIQKLPPPRGEEEEAGAMVAVGEGAKKQPVLVAEPPSSSTAVQMVYNVGSVGGAAGSETPVEAVPWSSNPSGRGGASRFRNPSNPFQQYY